MKGGILGGAKLQVGLFGRLPDLRESAPDREVEVS